MSRKGICPHEGRARKLIGPGSHTRRDGSIIYALTLPRIGQDGGNNGSLDKAGKKSLHDCFLAWLEEGM